MTSRSTAPGGRTGRPPRTSREQILTAARELVDRDGWDKLTIRRLAGDLGVGATTLYHHVRDKEDLLIQLLDYYADQIPRPELPEDARERIVVAATVMHDSLAGWPRVAEALTSDDLVGRSALWMVDAIVGGAIDCGCTREQAVDLYRSVWYYTVGEILVRANSARRRSVDERPVHRDVVYQGLDGAELPNLAAFGEKWAELAARETYPMGLRAFVDGLLAALVT
jgi:AcrR family transcriptional regulator